MRGNSEELLSAKEIGNRYGGLIWTVKSNGCEIARIVFCPKTGKPYEEKTWKAYSIPRLDCVELETDGSSIEGIGTTDIVSFCCVEIKQGRTEFNYPYDIKDIDAFSKTEIVKNPVDGDFITYTSGGSSVVAYASLDAAGDEIVWLDHETFVRYKKLPIPDPDSALVYYRRQAINTQCVLAGGIKCGGDNFYSFAKYGIEEAKRLSDKRDIARNIDFPSSLLAGYIHWTEDLKRYSFKDPRKFYIALKDGKRVFAMKHGDQIFSPITHAVLPVCRDDIARFEVISDNAYEERDCYNVREVEELYAKYKDSEANVEEKDSLKKRKCLTERIAGYAVDAFILPVLIWIAVKALRHVSETIDNAIKQLPPWLNVIIFLIVVALYIIIRILIE